jgi:DNA-binding response OmpR family regulator
VARRIHKQDQELQLSAREFDLLSILMKNAGRALSREELLAEVWGDDWIGGPTMDAFAFWMERSFVSYALPRSRAC